MEFHREGSVPAACLAGFLADPGEARGCSTYSLMIHSLIQAVSQPYPPSVTALRRLHAQTVRDSTSSYKSDYSDQELSKSRRA